MVYDFFGGTEVIDLIYKKRNNLYLLVLAHIPTLYFDSLTWFVLLKKGLFLFCGHLLLHGSLKPLVNSS